MTSSMNQFKRRGRATGGRDATENAVDQSNGGEREGHFGGIGLPESAGWYVSAALYWIGGLSVLLIERFSDGHAVNQGVAILATIVLACSPLLILGARFLPNVWWGAHLRILLPLGVLAVGAVVVGDSIGALMLITMFPTLAIAYLHAPKIAVPYCLLTIANIVVALIIFDNSPSHVTRAVVVGGVLLVVTGGLIFAQARLRRLAALNHDLSVTDPLTGLANLRRLQNRLRQEIQRSTRNGNSVVIFAIDLDDFKEVNDRFSYALGDRVLKSVAIALTEEMEPGDLLVRRGGDEFAVLTIATPARDLERFRKRIHSAIVRARRAVCPEVNPNASVTFVQHVFGETPEQFLRRVDDGLHDAKLDAHPERRELELAEGKPDAAAESVFSAGLDESEPEFTDTAVRRSASASDMDDRRAAWWFTAGAVATPAILMAAVAVGGTAPDLRNSTIAACIVALAVCAGISVLGALRRAPLWLMHIPLALSLVFTTIAIFHAGESRQALIELYALQTPLVIYCLNWVQAIPYAAASMFFYSYFLVTSNYQFIAVRVAIFVGVMAVLYFMLARGRRAGRKFASDAERLSVVDPLTGVANLRGFHRRVEDEIDRCRLVGDELALIMVDLDGFKFVNDRYSHTMGDAVLVETANAIRQTVREDEMVARRGGDEFAIVCVPEAHANMDAFAARIAGAIEAARLKLTHDLPGGATVRYVFWNGAEGPDELMRRADADLHDAKALQRIAASSEEAREAEPA
ncbi:MAG: diguanylate cyclase [Solirubrobacterales bacterium]